MSQIWRYWILLLLITGIYHEGSGQQLAHPWAGGMNACQFCSLDMNLDGTDDLLVFDRHGNRKMTWIRTISGFMNDQSFANSLPDLHDWIITADYNCDGKMDLFTYSLGGARVFENISDDSLRFRLVTDLLQSYYYSGYVGILLTSVDYPAVSDIDDDGDLDLLTFFGLGSYVEYHRNMSMEKFGNCDSLDYMLAEHCWGNFKESEGSNQLMLDIVCPYKHSNRFTCNPVVSDEGKHTGSTLLAADLNGDGIRDLLLGDVDYPNLIMLANGGTTDSAHMVSQDTSYPGGTRPIRIFSFPSANLIDINGDGLHDLLVSPFDPGYANAENKHSSWAYLNAGNNAAPVFQYYTDSWLQDEMLDFGTASYPLLTDLNNDGRTDILAGNFGYYDSSYYENLLLHSDYTSKIAYLKNTGAGFTMATEDLADASSTGFNDLYPAAGDLDGDGAKDLIVGQADGTLIWFRNRNTGSDPPVFDTPVLKYQNIDVGNNSTPQLFDLDEDGLADLIIGEQGGNLNYYRNTGAVANPVFQYVTDSLGGINVTNPLLSYYGYSTPCFFRGPDGVTGLLAGSEEGKIHFFKNIDGNLTGHFTRCDTLSQITGGAPFLAESCRRSAPSAGFITDTEFHDIIAGNFSGGLKYYSPRTLPQVIIGIGEYRDAKRTLPVTAVPNPANDFVKISVHDSEHPGHQLSLYDSRGSLVYHTSFHKSIILSVGNSPSGLYLVRVTSTSGKTGISRLIIIH